MMLILVFRFNAGTLVNCWGRHSYLVQWVYLYIYVLRLHSLFLKKMHDIQICFQQDNVPTFLSVNFKPNVLWILKNDHESIGGASERKWKENYHNINIKKYFYTSSKKSSLCYHFDLINFSLFFFYYKVFLLCILEVLFVPVKTYR